VEQIEIQFSCEANVMLKIYIGNVVFLPISAGEAKWKSKVLASCSRPMIVKLFFRNEAFREMQGNVLNEIWKVIILVS